MSRTGYQRQQAHFSMILAALLARVISHERRVVTARHQEGELIRLDGEVAALAHHCDRQPVFGLPRKEISYDDYLQAFSRVSRGHGRAFCHGRARPNGSSNSSVDQYAGQGREQYRHVAIQGRRTEQRDRCQGLRLPRPDAWRRGVRECLSGRFGVGPFQGLQWCRRVGQHGLDLVGADGRKVRVPDPECGHRLFLGQPECHKMGRW